MRDEWQNIQEQLLQAEHVLNQAVVATNQRPDTFLTMCGRIQAIRLQLDDMQEQMAALGDAKREAAMGVDSLKQCSAGQLEAMRAAAAVL